MKVVRSLNDDQLRVVHSWLKDAYWSKGLPEEVLRTAIKNSMVFLVVIEDEPVGFARVVSDLATFAWVSDVMVAESARGSGVGQLLMTTIMQELKPLALRRICLTTKDAHTLYAKFGFNVTETPSNWMEIKDNEIYSRSK